MSQHPHKRTIDHLPSETRYQRFNKKLALFITEKVGSMTCAYLFAALAFVSLPEVLASHNMIAIVSWIAQTFFQLVLLSVILVGQNIQTAAADARANKTFEDTERALDLLNTETPGGLKDVLEAIHKSKVQ